MSKKPENLKRKPTNKDTPQPEKKIKTNEKEGKQIQKKEFKKKPFAKKDTNTKKDNENTEKTNKPSQKYRNKKMAKTVIKADQIDTEKLDQEEDPTLLLGNVTMGQINKLVQQLWSKTTPEKIKHNLIKTIIGKITPVVTQLVHKREGSRSVQACIKYGTEAQQNQVFELILKNKEFPEIIKSKYGHFLALRMIKQMKKKEIKEKFFQHLVKNAYYLVSHVEGAKVIDSYLRNLAKPSELTAIKQVFDQVIEKQKGTDLKEEKFEGIENLALKIIDKANHYPLISKYILVLALPMLVAAEREKVVDYLKEKVLDLIEDREGVKLCLELINYSAAKDRKIIIKNLKDHIVTIATSESAFGFLVVQKLIHSLDDTVLLERQVIKPLKHELQKVVDSKHGFQIISSIFIPNHNAVKTVEKEIKFTTSKKDDDVRLKQLQVTLIDDCVKLLQSYDDNKLLKNMSNSRFLSGILKYILNENVEKHFQFVKDILNKFLDDKNFKNDKAFEESLINHIDSHRVLKGVLALSSSLLDKSKEIVDEYIEQLNQQVATQTELFVKNRSSIYIVIALIEQTTYKDFVISQVKSLNLKQIADKKVEGKDCVGINILKNLL